MNMCQCGSVEQWFLHKLVVTFIIVVALLVLLGAGHSNPGNTTQIIFLTEPNKFGLEIGFGGLGF